MEKIKILGAILTLPALPIQPIHRENGPNWLNWQCCLAGNSKTALRILIFSIAMGADYSFELISIETYAPQFIGHNKIFLGSVNNQTLAVCEARSHKMFRLVGLICSKNYLCLSKITYYLLLQNVDHAHVFSHCLIFSSDNLVLY